MRGQFEKGCKGGPGGKKGNNSRGKDKLFRGALLRAMLELDTKKRGETLRKISLKMLELALEGEQWAVQELANRLDGKVANISVDAGDDDGGGDSRPGYIVYIPAKPLGD